MTRWIVDDRTNQYDHPRPDEIVMTYIVRPTSLGIGPAFIAEFPQTDEGKSQAERIVRYLNAEYVAGMHDAQVAARQAFAMALGTDEKVFEIQKESDDDAG